MEIIVSIHQVEKPIAVLRVKGEINAANYLDIVTKAQEIYRDSAKDLILDLSEVPNITSTGLVALHQLSLIYSGVPQRIETDGTEVRTDFTHSNSARRHVKLLSPQLVVDKALESAGLKLFFKIFGDLESAIESFKK